MTDKNEQPTVCITCPICASYHCVTTKDAREVWEQFGNFYKDHYLRCCVFPISTAPLEKEEKK